MNAIVASKEGEFYSIEQDDMELWYQYNPLHGVACRRLASHAVYRAINGSIGKFADDHWKVAGHGNDAAYPTTNDYDCSCSGQLSKDVILQLLAHVDRIPGVLGGMRTARIKGLLVPRSGKQDLRHWVPVITPGGQSIESIWGEAFFISSENKAFCSDESYFWVILDGHVGERETACSAIVIPEYCRHNFMRVKFK